MTRSPRHPLVLALGIAVGTIALPAATARACLVPPVSASISARFVEPSCPFCAGQRGLEFAGTSGATVRAAAGGTVTFSGVVVDTRYVVVRHADGLLATYGGLRSASLSAGDRVAAGAAVGIAGPTLYFGLRRESASPGPATYLDPEPLLGTLVVPPYLVPTDGSPGRPPPPAQLVC